MKLLPLIPCLLLAVFANVKPAKANIYQPDYGYNIFTAETWIITPYAFFGYALTHDSYKESSFGNSYNVPKKTAHGLKAGVGVSINRNWLLEISVVHTKKTSEKSNDVANIQAVSAVNTILDVDVYVKLPFQSPYGKLNTYVTGGANIVNFATNKRYIDPNQPILAKDAKEQNKTAFGLNIGIAVSYNITEHLYVMTDLRKLWVLTSSPVKDSVLFSLTAGIRF